MGEEAAKVAAQAAIEEVRRIEYKYSRYRDDSIISQINAAAGSGVGIPIDEETQQLIAFAQTLYEQSDGLFDITSGVLRRAWDFKTKRMPKNDELTNILPIVGLNKLINIAGKLLLTMPSMQIDLGGIGKEYAADRAAIVLKAHGVAQGFVNLGGDIHVLGPLSQNVPWTIGISHPRIDYAQAAKVAITQGAIATSGDSERYFVVDGKRYCHILSPKTGWPVSGWQSVTVIAPTTIMAGALTTIAMLKEDKAIPFLDSYQLPYFAIRSDGAVFQSSALPATAHKGSIPTALGRFIPT